MAWVMVWLASMAGIGWGMLNLAVPRVQNKIQAHIQQSVSDLDDAVVNVTVNGLQATLTGQAGTTETKQSLLKVAARTFSIRPVVDKLTVDQPSVTESIQLAENATAIRSESETPQSDDSIEIDRTDRRDDNDSNKDLSSEPVRDAADPMASAQDDLVSDKSNDSQPEMNRPYFPQLQSL